ncbi:MAG: ROK family protein [Bacilli bacterium]|jgi:glucokinase
MKSNSILAIDAGGTFLKSTIINNGILKDVKFVPVNSNGSKEEILNSFLDTISLWDREGFCDIRIAIPGPFNYSESMSLSRHKFSALYGLNLADEIRYHCDLTDIDIFFFSDTNTFLKGQIYLHPDLLGKRVAAITIGTGLGLSLFYDGRIITNENGGPREVIFNLPVNDQEILEDYVSNRGICNHYNERSKTIICTSAKEVAQINNFIAKEVYLEMGNMLGKFLKPILKKHKIDILIVGGQISKSYSMFKKTLTKQLVDVQIICFDNIDNVTFYGLL